MAVVAQQAGVTNMVNLSHRNASATHKAYELIQTGKLGHIMHVKASYRQSWLGEIGRKRTSGSGGPQRNMAARTR